MILDEIAKKKVGHPSCSWLNLKQGLLVAGAQGQLQVKLELKIERHSGWHGRLVPINIHTYTQLKLAQEIDLPTLYSSRLQQRMKNKET